MADKKISQLPAASTPLAGTEVLPIVQSSTTDQVSVADLTAGRTVAMAGATISGLTASKPVFTDASKNLTSSGTVPTAQGGTNLTSFTANGVVYASSTSVLATGSNLTFTGTNFGIGIGTATEKLHLYRSDGTGVYIRLQDNTGTNYIGTDSGNLVFLDGSANERLRIASAGDVTFKSGNLIQGTAAKGINFTANTPAAGMTSQLLNWYEEGTWTPVVTSSAGSITSYTATGTYTRVGRQVTASFYIDVTNNGTGSGLFRATGFPFNAAAAGKEAGCGAEIASTGFSVSVAFASTTMVYIRKYDATYPAATGNKFCCTITYMV